MAFTLYEREDVHYRTPADAPWEMEVYRPGPRAWVPYQGDIAKVLIEASIIPAPTKYSDSEPRDDHGRWSDGGSSGSDFLASQSDAILSLAAGESITVARENVRGILQRAAKREDHPDLTKLHVDGMDIFHSHGLDIAREDMPQIPSKDRQAFIDEMRDQGVKMKDENISALKLKPVQKEISATTVGQMLKRFETGESRKNMAAIFVSKDNYVLDGHHRWAVMAALTIEYPSLKMPITRLGVEHTRALELMLNYNDAHGIASKPHGKWLRPWLKYSEEQPRDDHGRWAGDSSESFFTEAEHYHRIGNTLQALISAHGADWVAELSRLHQSGKLDAFIAFSNKGQPSDLVEVLRRGLQLLRDAGKALPTVEDLRFTKLPVAVLEDLLKP